MPPCRHPYRVCLAPSLKQISLLPAYFKSHALPSLTPLSSACSPQIWTCSRFKTSRRDFSQSFSAIMDLNRGLVCDCLEKNRRIGSVAWTWSGQSHTKHSSISSTLSWKEFWIDNIIHNTLFSWIVLQTTMKMFSLISMHVR